MDASINAAELGLTAKDRGLSFKPATENIALAQTKIARFGTPEFFAGYQEISNVSPPSFTEFRTLDGSQFIDMVGTQHYHQMEDPEKAQEMVQKIKAKVEDYLQKTESNPDSRLFMIEGTSLPGVTTVQDKMVKHDKALKDLLIEKGIKNIDEAVENFGEMGAVIYIAKEKNIPIMSPEPTNEQIIQEQKEAGVEDIDIALKQSILGLDVLVHRGEKREDKQYTQDELFSALKDACNMSGWNKDTVPENPDDAAKKEFVDSTLASLNQRMSDNKVGFNLVNPDYTWSFDPTDKETYNLLHSPASTVDIFKKISNISGEFRDDHILDQTIDAVAEGKSPFIIYGDGHTVKLKPAFSTIFHK